MIVRQPLDTSTKFSTAVMERVHAHGVHMAAAAPESTEQRLQPVLNLVLHYCRPVICARRKFI
jgi:hypothetical protein